MTCYTQQVYKALVAQLGLQQATALIVQLGGLLAFQLRCSLFRAGACAPDRAATLLQDSADAG